MIWAELDGDAHAVAVRFIAERRDAVHHLLPLQVGDRLDEAGLIDLVGQLRHDDAALAAVHFFHRCAGAHRDAAAAGAVHRFDAAPSHDEARRGEIRAFDVLHELIYGDVRLVDHMAQPVDDLAHIVRRDIGRHAHGDAVGTVHQKIGDARRKHQRLLEGTVVVRHEIDGVLIQIAEHFRSDLRHAHFRITHGRRGVAVDGAEIAVPVHQRIPGGKILRHAHCRFIDGGVAVGMVLAQHVADDAGGFLIGLARQHARFLHGVQNAAVHRLHPVPHIGKRAGDDDGHRVIDVGCLHLPFQRGGDDFAFLPIHKILLFTDCGKGRHAALPMPRPARQERSYGFIIP